MSTIARWHFVLIEVTAMFPAVTLAGIANAANPLHPTLAADGVTSDDAALAKAADALLRGTVYRPWRLYVCRQGTQR
ncbi:MAG TPA: hypothetical protein VKC66_26115 [Xanthobacteraceae bacterium]|nr:hypothetical protein [Xanthobacteraceae bacterium]